MSDAPRQRATGPTLRCDVRFEDRRLVVRISDARGSGGVRLELLEAVSGPLPRPYELSGGLERCRHRATTASLLRAEVRLRALEQYAADAGVRLAVRDVPGVAAEVLLDDGTGAVVAPVLATFEGGDLVLAPLGARAAVDGPAPALRRWLDGCRRLGANVVGATARWTRLLRALMADALLPAGHRVPDDTALVLSGCAIRDGGIVFEAGLEGIEPWCETREAWVRLRDALVALAQGEAVRARDRLECLVPRSALRIPQPTPVDGLVTRAWVEALLEEGAESDDGHIDGEASESHDPHLVCARFRLAMRSGQPDRVLGALHMVLAHEPFATVRAQAVSAALDRLEPVDAPRALEALRVALGRFPLDEAFVRRALPIAARLQAADVLHELGRRVLGAPLPAAVRGRLGAGAALALESIGRPGPALDFARQAVHADPDVADAHLAFGRALARIGRPDAALVRLERAATLYEREGEGERAADALEAAANAAIRIGRYATAEALLQRALALDPSNARTVDALAGVQTRLGALDAAAGTYERLLADGLSGRDAALHDALEHAIAFHLEVRLDGAGARPFVEALQRAGADTDRVDAWRRRIDGPAPGPHTAAGTLRAVGDHAGAARLLAREAATSRDAASLRAAIEAAEASGQRRLLEEVLRTALSWLDEGPTRRAVEARLALVAGRPDDPSRNEPSAEAD
ncbi:MAG: tetratricopeptide repeat protein [Myxococcota bacterium]|nr:tetratricopeptide repeat protein [Myxococcota bacterium]MDW8363523.1 hypothetical protein [Myxococcales bacterium]